MNRDVAAMSNSGAHARARPVEANPRSQRWVVYASLTLCAVAWTLVSGKDLNWDVLNYHLFSGFSGVHDRIGEEFFPAGAASYFNPYAQVPFYLMVSAGVPAVAIGAVLAAVHSLNLWLTYELAMAMRPPDADKWVHATAALAVALAALNPVLLQVTGSSFADATASVPALAGWLALILAYRRPSPGWILAGGILLGGATALKLSNGLFALAAVPLVLLRPVPTARRLLDAAAFGATCALAFLVVAGPWAWRLWSEFGNPLFPLFNAWFASPDFIIEALRHDRFLPHSFSDALLRPVQMAVPERMIHTEPRAPDLRYAVLFAALAIFAIVRIVRRQQGSETVVHGARHTDRALTALVVAFLAAWAAWLAVSGNSRYFLPMACVAAVLLATLVQRLAGSSRRAFAYIGGALLLVQFVAVALGAQLRWTHGPWSGQWFNVTIPDRFRSEPYLYLSLNVQSGSFLAVFVSPGSRFMNVSGSYILDPERPGGDRAQRLIDAHRGRVRMLLPVQSVDARGDPIAPSFDTIDGRVARFGLRSDPSDCAYLRVEGGLDVLRHASAPQDASESNATTHFLTCALVDARDAVERYRREQRVADVILDRIEDACPDLFHPRRPATELSGVWGRHYVLGSDLQLWIARDGTVKYSNPVVGGDAVVIGKAADWASGPQPIDCSRRRGGGIERIAG